MYKLSRQLTFDNTVHRAFVSYLRATTSYIPTPRTNTGKFSVVERSVVGKSLIAQTVLLWTNAIWIIEVAFGTQFETNFRIVTETYTFGSKRYESSCIRRLTRITDQGYRSKFLIQIPTRAKMTKQTDRKRRDRSDTYISRRYTAS